MMANLRELVAFTVFCIDWGVDCGDWKQNDVPYWWSKWQTDFRPALDQPHWGDCVQVPTSCIRCLVEMWYKMADAILAVWDKENANGSNQD